jgi:hypothetical protein
MSGPMGRSTTTMPMAAPRQDTQSAEPPPMIEAALKADGGPPVTKPVHGGRHRLILVVAGGVAAVALAVVAVTLVSGSSEPKATSHVTAPATGGAAAPPPSPSGAPPRSGATPSIDNEKTDRRPLRLTDVFPGRPLPLGGRVYKQDMTSVNHDCSLVARGALAEALVRWHCRSVVRATYVDTKKRIAVTAGVVAMPTRAFAVAVGKAGDPRQYEWFRGMAGKVAKDVDQAGGYAASTVRGRYIIYSYTTYLDGHGSAADALLATVGRQFVAYAVRPIEQRSR